MANRLNLHEFLYSCIGVLPNVEWVDQQNKLFKIPWVRANAHGVTEEHFEIFRRYEESHGRHLTNMRKQLPDAKQRFQAALRRLKFKKEQVSSDYIVFSFPPETPTNSSNSSPTPANVQSPAMSEDSGYNDGLPHIDPADLDAVLQEMIDYTEDDFCNFFDSFVNHSDEVGLNLQDIQDISQGPQPMDRGEPGIEEPAAVKQMAAELRALPPVADSAAVLLDDDMVLGAPRVAATAKPRKKYMPPVSADSHVKVEIFYECESVRCTTMRLPVSIAQQLLPGTPGINMPSVDIRTFRQERNKNFVKFLLDFVGSDGILIKADSRGNVSLLRKCKTKIYLQGNAGDCIPLPLNETFNTGEKTGSTLKFSFGQRFRGEGPTRCVIYATAHILTSASDVLLGGVKNLSVG